MTTLRLGIAQKLWIVCLAFGLPIAVMFVLMVQAKLEQVEFAEQELAGSELLRPLVQVLEHATAFRAGSLRGGDEQGLPGLSESVARLTAALDDLDRKELMLGPRLQFTPEGLGLRGRTAFTAAGLRGRWQGALAGDTRESYDALVAHVRTMITHAGDTSNLILDPDLDTYYVMDAVLLALPALEARLNSMLDELQLAREGSATVARDQLVLDAAFVGEAEWGRARASFETALVEDPNFYGESATLRASLQGPLQATDRAVQQLLTVLHAQLTAREADPAALAQLQADVVRLNGLVHRLHEVGFAQLDVLLRRRIEALQQRLWFGCALALLAVLVAAISAVLLARGIVRGIARIRSATQAFAAGDAGARAGDVGTDELGALASSFDAMATHIGGLTSEINARAAELATLNASLEHTVEERTRELSHRNDEIQLILDVAHDGMLTIDLKGQMSSERSAAVERLLGACSGCRTLQDYVRAHDADFAASLQLGISQVEGDELPLELTLAQLPTRIRLLPDGAGEEAVQETGVRARRRVLGVAYQPIMKGEHVQRLRVVRTDITSELAAEHARASQEEAMRIFHACQRDHAGFLSFMLEGRELVARVGSQAIRGGAELGRALHTLKGNCGLFGVLSVASLCHELEHRLAELGGSLSERDVIELNTAWEDALALASQFMGEHAARALEVSESEYAALVDAIAHGRPRKDLLVEIARWKLESVERRLQRFGDQAVSVAARLGKKLTVNVDAAGLRVSEKEWAPMWSALVHVVRNAVDHGIESGEERVEKGKPATGALRFSAYVRERTFVLELADDGRGIAWEALAEKAKAAGLPHVTRSQLVDAMFSDGVSTKDQVTQLSGRGVGMAAVREACSELGGRIEVESVTDRGTTIRCIYPRQAMSPEPLAIPSVVDTLSLLPSRVGGT